MKIIVILNNIRSSENVGSIFRTADAALVSKIILSGYTPAPVDRFGRENSRLAKAALGAEKFVEWEKVETLKEAVEAYSNNFIIIGVEQDEKAIDYRKLEINKSKDIVLIFGNEVGGLSKEDLKLCNLITQIPMRGKKESLNVAVSVGIVLYSLNNL